MKNALLLLLLANILVLFWYAWIEAPPRPSKAAASPPEDISESPTVVDIEKLPSPPPELSKAELPVCFLSEPIFSLESAEALAATFAETGLVTSLIESEEKVPIDYWVRIGGFPNSAAARATVKALRTAGMLDSYAMQDADIDGVWLVSLGVYRQQDGAESIAETANNNGFLAVVTPRLRASAIYTVQVAGDERDLRASVSATEAYGRYLPCDSVPAGSFDMTP